MNLEGRYSLQYRGLLPGVFPAWAENLPLSSALLLQDTPRQLLSGRQAHAPSPADMPGRASWKEACRLHDGPACLRETCREHRSLQDPSPRRRRKVLTSKLKP